MYNSALSTGKSKYNTKASLGLSAALPIPQRVWEDIAMDFIICVLNSMGYAMIFIVIDRLFKYCHLGYQITSVSKNYSVG